MKQFSILAASLLMAATTAQAGGYLTNTNQSVNFLRNPARDGAIGIDGAYSNPAGVGFMSVGWHLGFDIQSAYRRLLILVRRMLARLRSERLTACATILTVSSVLTVRPRLL